MPPVTLDCENLGKAFGRRWLFRRINLKVSKGTGLVIIGPNGSGKTTLLRLLCGLVSPTEGQVLWCYEDEKLPPHYARPLLGVVLPDCEPYEELTAWENLSLVADLRDVPIQKAQDWLKRVDLHSASHQLTREFSSGMKMRLKLAMAMLHEPAVLLLDEPTAMLDSSGRVLVSEIIAEQKQRGIVVIATNEERDLAYGEQQIVLG